MSDLNISEEMDNVTHWKACLQGAYDTTMELSDLVSKYDEGDIRPLLTKLSNLSSLYNIGLLPSPEAREYVLGLNPRSLQSLAQFNRLRHMFHTQILPPTARSMYEDSDELTTRDHVISYITDKGEKSSLLELHRIIEDMYEKKPVSLDTIKYIVNLYNDDDKRIGVILDSDQVDAIIEQNKRPKEYLEESECGEFA